MTTASFEKVASRLATLGLGADAVPARASVVVVPVLAAEPLAVGDLRAAERLAEAFVGGAKAAMRWTGAKRAVFAVEAGAEAAQRALTQAIAEDGFAKFHIAVVPLAAGYPDGLSGRRIARQLGLEPEATAVLAPTTVLALEAVTRDRPLTHRHVAVVGAVPRPATWWAPVGAPVSLLVAASGGAPQGAVLLAGGPLSGRAVPADAPLTWGMGTLAVLPAGHPLAMRRGGSLDRARKLAIATCESCQVCTEACPEADLGLAPHRLVRAIGGGPVADPLAGTAVTCTSCGACTLACPVDLDPAGLVSALREGLLAQDADRPMAAGGHRPIGVPMPRGGGRSPEVLALKLDLARYASEAPWAIYDPALHGPALAEGVA